MKQINLFILLTIAGINTCAMAPKNTKISPAVAAATRTLQAKPIVFFNTEDLNTKRDSQNGSNAVIRFSKSDEMKDIELEHHDNQQNYTEKIKNINEKIKIVHQKFEDKQITKDRIEALRKESHSLLDQTNKANEEVNAKGSEFGKKAASVQKKISVICKNIAKRLGACAFFVIHDNSEFGLLQCVDPAYDITQEVFDTLNREYNTNKPQKSTCNQSCCVHCPLSNRQH